MEDFQKFKINITCEKATIAGWGEGEELWVRKII